MTDDTKSDTLARWRSLRELQLLEWTTSAKYLHDISLEATKIAAEFGRLGIQSAFLLNGGALAGLPAIAEYIHLRSSTSIAGAAWAFAAGLTFAALCTVTAYLNFTFMSGFHAREGTRRTNELDRNYSIAVDTKSAKELPKWPDRRQNALWWAVNVTVLLALALAIGSFVEFLCGAFAVIDLAQASR